MNVQIHKDIKIEYKENKQYILVHFKNVLFLKQDYIKSRDHSLFLVILILSRFGLVYLK
jgi:hypothetical protein